MVSFRLFTQAICLLSTISLSHAEEAHRSEIVGYSKLFTRNFVNHALLPRQLSCSTGEQLCADGECALASDTCCTGGGSCHAGYTCYGTSITNGGCCPNGKTCSGPGVGCTGTDVYCGGACHPAGYNCNSSPSAVPSFTTPSGSTPTQIGSGCLSNEKTCGSNYCIPSDGICCGNGYYCDPGHVCRSDGLGNYKCPLGGSSGATSSFGFGGTSSSAFAQTTSLRSGASPTSNLFSFVNSATSTRQVVGTATGSFGPIVSNSGGTVCSNVFGGLAGLFLVLLGV